MATRRASSGHLWHGDLAKRRYGEINESWYRYGVDPAADICLNDEEAWKWASPKDAYTRNWSVIFTLDGKTSMSTATERLLFYIIYTPGTVRTLLPFVDTLLHWSDCTYCLIANGCGEDELTLLRDRCAAEPRLNWQRLPWPYKVEHGHALNHLFAISDLPYFSFMDSDILATGDFMAELRPLLPDAAGLFSAWPMTIKAQERLLPAASSFIAGRHSHTEAGLCLGGSYFAIYVRAVLKRSLAQAPDGFNRGYWAQLPRRTQRFLCTIDQERRFYDTGRLLNLYVQSQGGKLCVHDCSVLLHLGSYSIYTGRARSTSSRWLTRVGAVARRVRDHLNGQAYRTAILKQVAQDPIQQRVNKRRQVLTAYFADLIAATAVGEVMPAPPQMQDAEIERMLEQAIRALKTLQVNQ
jgi:hypothetical protein